MTNQIGKRITVIIDDENLKKLRLLQAKKIKIYTESVSFSRIINETINKGLK